MNTPLDDQDLPPKRTPATAFAAALAVSLVIFLAWLFVLPHRVPEGTRSELSPTTDDVKANVEDVVSRTSDARQELKEEEQEIIDEEEQKRIEDLEKSKQELESQGFRTTAPSTDDEN